MTPAMPLIILTPLSVVVDEPALRLRGTDATGSFGVQPGHADFLTRLALSVLSWTTDDGAARFCAVRGGVLTVTAGRIAIATREAVVGDDLGKLDGDVLMQFRTEADAERVESTESTRLHLSAMRQMMARLQRKPRGGGP